MANSPSLFKLLNMSTVNGDFLRQVENIGFQNARDIVQVPTENGNLRIFRLTENIESSLGWGRDKLKWTFSTDFPRDINLLGFVMLTLEKAIPDDIGIKSSIEKSWRILGPGDNPIGLPTRLEMINQLYEKEALVIDKYNQMRKAAQVYKSITPETLYNQSLESRRRP